MVFFFLELRGRFNAYRLEWRGRGDVWRRRHIRRRQRVGLQEWGVERKKKPIQVPIFRPIHVESKVEPNDLRAIYNEYR